MIKRLLHLLGFHTWVPEHQTIADFIFGYRTWACSCGKQETRKETEPDSPSDILERLGC